MAWLYGAALAAGIVALALRPGEFAPGLRDLRPVRNPLGVEAAAPVLGPVNAASRLVVTVLYLAAVASLLGRLRHARGIQRQQLKWVTYAGALLIGFLLLVSLLEDGGAPAVQLAVQIGFFFLGGFGVPTAVAVAILRHRLYDIDRIINRTLVYGLLTAILGIGYGGAVLLMGRLFGGVTEDPPSWAVAAVTLAVATSGELLAVVDQTMRPTTVSLWLRPDLRRGRLA